MSVRSADDTLECGDERRSGVLREAAHPLNGIDFVEFRREPGNRFILDVTFLKPAPADHDHRLHRQWRYSYC